MAVISSGVVSSSPIVSKVEVSSEFFSVFGETVVVVSEVEVVGGVVEVEEDGGDGRFALECFTFNNSNSNGHGQNLISAPRSPGGPFGPLSPGFPDTPSNPDGPGCPIGPGGP